MKTPFYALFAALALTISGAYADDVIVDQIDKTFVIDGT